MFKILKKETLKKNLQKVSLLIGIFLSGFFLSGFYSQTFKNYFIIEGFPHLQQKGYHLVYDGAHKVPLWTHERLTKESLTIEAQRNEHLFYENSNVYSFHRSTLSDYYRSGFDRGHMVPAADQRFEEGALKETFLLTNICPQNPELNRGYWAQLERYIRAQVVESDSVDVITGPLFLSQKVGEIRQVCYQVIGENEVAVPTHFFKIIQTKKGSTKHIEAYCLPNQAIALSTPLEEFKTSLEHIEKSSGLYFRSLHPDQTSFKSRLEASY